MKNMVKKVLAVLIAMVTVFSTFMLFANAYEPAVVLSAKTTSVDTLRKSFKTGKNSGINYKYYEPAGRRGGGSYPLVVFIHGLGHGWTNNSQLSDSYMPLMTTQEMQSKFREGGAYILLPQMPEYAIDATIVELVWKAIDNFANTHSVDKNQIYLMGASAGGGTSWRLLINHREYFKAAVIACATHVPSHSEIKKIGNIPVWIVSAKTDPLVWYAFQQSAWKNLRSTAISDRCRFTTFGGAVYFPDGKKAGITHFMAKAITYNFELINPDAYSGKVSYDGVSYPGTATVDMNGRNIPTTGIIEWFQEQDKDIIKQAEIPEINLENPAELPEISEEYKYSQSEEYIFPESAVSADDIPETNSTEDEGAVDERGAHAQSCN